MEGVEDNKIPPHPIFALLQYWRDLERKGGDLKHLFIPMF